MYKTLSIKSIGVKKREWEKLLTNTQKPLSKVAVLGNNAQIPSKKTDVCLNMSLTVDWKALLF